MRGASLAFGRQKQPILVTKTIAWIACDLRFSDGKHDQWHASQHQQWINRVIEGLLVQSVLSMECLRDRGFAYAIGAVEFLDNVRLNILDAWLPYQSPHHISKNADSLEGKVTRISPVICGVSWEVTSPCSM